jgi:hypothetical protein
MCLEPVLPLVGCDQPLSQVLPVLRNDGAALVMDGGLPVGVISAQDALACLVGQRSGDAPQERSAGAADIPLGTPPAVQPVTVPAVDGSILSGGR